jgi:uncharacterized protein YbjT (DUF2867 family)
MDVAIAGGHGKIALLLGRLLAERGDRVRGLIRKPAQARELEAAGMRPMLCDLESRDADVAAAVQGADAVVFAAGAGPGSGAERKRTVDLGGSLRLIEAAEADGIRRYLMVSAMGAAEPPLDGGEVYGEYLRAKAEADAALQRSDLDFTIVRPGGLTDEPPGGRVSLAPRLPRGQVSRADVAAVLAACVEAPNTFGKTFDLTAGETPVERAVAEL